MNFDFSNIKVLVVGDFMIDHYIIGESNRMSPRLLYLLLFQKGNTQFLEEQEMWQ